MVLEPTKNERDRNSISDNMQFKSMFVLHTECQWEILKELQRQEQNWLETKSAASEQGLFPKAQPHASTTCIPHAGAPQGSLTLCCGHSSPCRALGTRVHTNAWNTKAVLWARESDSSSRAGAEEEGMRQQMVSKPKTHTNTPENRWGNSGRVSITGVTWSSLEQHLCCECSWIGWAAKALQKRMAGRKL